MAASISCAICDHVEGLGRVVVDLGAHRLLAGDDAVLDHRPVDVVGLAVGDEDDVDVVGLLGVGGRRSGNRKGAKGEGGERRREALPAIPFSCSSTKLSLSGSQRHAAACRCDAERSQSWARMQEVDAPARAISSDWQSATSLIRRLGTAHRVTERTHAGELEPARCNAFAKAVAPEVGRTRPAGCPSPAARSRRYRPAR